MNIRRGLWIVAIFAIFALPARCDEAPAASPVQELRLEAGRSFGHTLGDRIRHAIHFRVDKPKRFDEASLPVSGPLNDWLDLREIKLGQFDEERSTRYTIEVVYQIFPALRESESREIPGLALRVISGRDNLAFETPESSLTVAPLIPARIADAEVTIRPAVEAKPISWTRHVWIVVILGASWTIVLAFWVWRRGFWPFFRSDRRPFACARRKLRRWRRARLESTEYRNALLAIHRAFNESAGEILFASGLENFFNQHPWFESMREKTGFFFALSEQVFFTGSPDLQDSAYSVRWLEQFCRDFQKIQGRGR
ncbi:MAG: hypothetical protein ACRESZ_11455 [Methylococcales bacterium]